MPHEYYKQLTNLNNGVEQKTCGLKNFGAGLIGLLVANKVGRLFIKAHPRHLVTRLHRLISHNLKGALGNAGLKLGIAHLGNSLTINVSERLANGTAQKGSVLNRSNAQGIAVVTNAVLVAVHRKTVACNRRTAKR